jgi:FkbM family methyltransferase
MYDADYDAAVVVDVGAHKGYFGAFALAEGARTVLSYEPQSRNSELLKRAADSLQDRAAWIVRRAAVGSTDRRDTLHIRPGSWSHSLAVTSDPREATRSEQVDVYAMATVLDAAQRASGRRVIVKIDAEGAECEIVLGTDVNRWRSVDELLLEHHDFAPCTLAELAAHLESAGLVHRERRHDEVDRFSRTP